jgi:hypothetical protein
MLVFSDRDTGPGFASVYRANANWLNPYTHHE